jgi:hypothetical protein
MPMKPHLLVVVLVTAISSWAFAQAQHEWDASDASIGHHIGKLENGILTLTAGRDPAGCFQSGPTDNKLPAGSYDAYWDLAVGKTSDAKAFRLEVFDLTEDKVLGSTEVNARDFSIPNWPQRVLVSFTVDVQRAKDVIEPRATWYGKVDSELIRIGFTQK